jgi:hypothetical protein
MADSAKDIIYGFLNYYGLGELGEWAWNMYLEGSSVEEIRLALPEQEAFQNRFPAYQSLANDGRAISPDQYIAYENQLFADLRTYGVPAGMYDSPQDVANLLVNDVSIQEARQRLAIAADAAYSVPKEVRDAMSERYNIPNAIGGLIGYYLDPDKALPVLTEQYASAQVIGAAAEQNISVETSLAERLAAQGVDYAGARQGFSNVAGMSDLTAKEQGGSVSQGDLIGGVFGDADARRKVERETARRSAQYQSSEGGAAATNTGVSGLGSAAS